MSFSLSIPHSRGSIRPLCSAASLLRLAVVTLFLAHASSTVAAVRVGKPPESFFAWVDPKDRDVARQFYRKHLDIQGLPVAASAEVADEALHRTHEIVSHMLAGRPDVLAAMIKAKMYLIIIGRNQVYTDMPEYRDHPNPKFQNERVRGTGGNPTSFGEENLLSLPLDRYDDESIAVHEFCHTIDGALRELDPTWKGRVFTTYQKALSKGLWKNTYAGSNPGEFWAEIAQAYFDCNRVNNWNHGPIGTREQLKEYDPESYELARSTFQLSSVQDWRYSWVQPLPNITAPPARFQIDPYYTKFTWAREFVVVGRGASDAALLKANDTVRKLFAYRHDILKIFINEKAKLAVLGPKESLSNLPEIRNASGNLKLDLNARYLDYQPELKLMVVAEENVMGNPELRMVGHNQIIRNFALAFHQATATRPEDPNWEKRGQDVQQYELRVQRLDVRFGQAVNTLFEKALAAGKWRGTSAIHDASHYWAAGVLAYFDATGQDAAPNDFPHPLRTREQLRSYDPELHDLVDQTMAYRGRVDWRFSAAAPKAP